MTLRDRLADWLTAGRYSAAVNAYADACRRADDAERRRDAMMKMHAADRLRFEAAVCEIDSDRLRFEAALREIAALETPRAAHGVRKAAAIARRALE